MRRTSRIAALLIGLSAGPAAATEIPPPGYTFSPAEPCLEDPVAAQKPRRPGDAVYAVCADQMALLAEALRTARTTRKLVLVTFGATWCPWCAALQRAMPSAELLGSADSPTELGRRFHHIDIGLSMVYKARRADIPSGKAALAHLLAFAPQTQIRAIPFLAIVSPQTPERVYARNLDDVTWPDHSLDFERLRELLREGEAYVQGKGARREEPGWLARKWARWWGR
jgi:thiol-disulfide isomerase/thioredoxin